MKGHPSLVARDQTQADAGGGGTELQGRMNSLNRKALCANVGTLIGQESGPERRRQGGRMDGTQETRFPWSFRPAKWPTPLVGREKAASQEMMGKPQLRRPFHENTCIFQDLPLTPLLATRAAARLKSKQEPTSKALGLPGKEKGWLISKEFQDLALRAGGNQENGLDMDPGGPGSRRVKERGDIGGLSCDRGINTLPRACSKAGFPGSYRDERIPQWQMV